MSPMESYHRSRAVKVLSQIVDNESLNSDQLVRRAVALVDPRNPEPMNDVFLLFARALSSGRYKNVVFHEDGNAQEVLQGFLLKIKHDTGTISQMFR